MDEDRDVLGDFFDYVVEKYEDSMPPWAEAFMQVFSWQFQTMHEGQVKRDIYRELGDWGRHYIDIEQARWEKLIEQRNKKLKKVTEALTYVRIVGIQWKNVWILSIRWQNLMA